MDDYTRIARMITYLHEHRQEQPSLKELADHLDLSEGHFHRLFRRWAGVTPKDFLQCITSAHARECLERGDTVLDAALDAGLSGPARLHDLCVTLEAATPGEIRKRGEGLSVRYGVAPSPFGDCLIVATERGLSNLVFLDGSDEAAAFVAAEWPRATYTREDGYAAMLSERIFTREAGAEPLRAWVQGTAFQVQVWRALLAVPEGALVTYGHLARAIGNPKAMRAVGSAVGANPIAVLIPCHRVIRESGALGGYRWHPVRKQALIGRERAGR